MNIGNIFDYVLQREREGRDFYQYQADRMSHAVAKGIFKKLAAEEEEHVSYIQGLMATSKNTTDADREFEPDQDSVFVSRVVSEKLTQSVIESMTPDVAILRTAYLIERDFAELYEKLANKAKGNLRLSLQKLASWEREHENLFKELHDKVFERYTNMPWGG